ncbi:MAG: EamA family transporter [Deltaproteobacteria bacterium]|nr:EamA family transporter [Deltaproteobacteria bacterium]
MDRRGFATVLGLLALAGWATSNALTRSLVESLGPFTVLAVGFGGGGLVLAAFETARARSPRRLVALPPRYALGAGACFVGYCGAYAFSYHLAPDDDAALTLGLANYLWPSFLLLLAPLFGAVRPRWRLLLPGVAIATAGVAAALPPAPGGAFAIPAAALALMLAAALLWALYSNLARRYGAADGPGGVPLFATATGALFLAARFASGETSSWDASLAAPLAFQAAFTCGVCYALWDLGMRRGDADLLGAASYGLPVAATLFACRWLDRPLTGGLALGAALVVLGAVLCRAATTPASTRA